MSTGPIPHVAKGSIFKILRFLCGLVVLATVLCFVDLRQFFQTFLALDPLPLALLLVLAMGCRFIRAWKWNRLLRARGVYISTWQAIRLSLVSHFAGAWTPGQLGGDAYRVIALRAYGRSDVVLSTVLIERYAGLCAVSFFSLVTLPITLPYLYQSSPWALAFVLFAIVAVAGVIPCLFSRSVAQRMFRLLPGLRASAFGGKIKQFYSTILEYRRHEVTLCIFGLATLVEVLSYFVINYLAARALGLDVSLLFFLFAMPIVHLLLRIPVSLQAVGVQEGCFVYALVLHGFTPAEGLAVSVVQRALEWIVAIVPGGLLLWLTAGPTPFDPQPDQAASDGKTVVPTES